ncbi:N-formimino-L-glutamate deiminase [Ameyamaea chiangmaiensis NBRC 103196]|uniref:Formimidoylglutamate deiminase n=1 Tax=Ameyamaea chiangmaiensis TaxID=442969 RepID=A0A850P4S1_9PROT|nr:formimidoylglutamate deiminase [Ameyamaea chiangmaiensis]MBS4075510.1 formimidoylglutamate deiminase [Ameyamaea chiangmaiensis]NVN38958.1 formimidoylglutamate deiminase [Ameyamaea chiangmaiensis]GBQ69483.1 N-formimino-L-glutamate deiminase [Ameyamaea chiangmaiensis NBRC 103196]
MTLPSTGFAEHALLPDGWRANVRLEVDAQGHFASVTPDATPENADWRAPLVVPAMPNLHSHAFQRAMAGLAEARLQPRDSFWTWRQLMYRLALRVTPEQLQAIARALYTEMLCAGYTHVAEFHYLHRDPQGNAYTDPAEMAQQLAIAARDTGIGLTLLPTLYTHAGFGATPLAEPQRRFASDPAFIDDLVTRIDRQRYAPGRILTGYAAHSLRAADIAAIRALSAQAADRPFHIHIAEQQAEIDQCVAATGQTPVACLLESVDVGRNWCLVHATHMTAQETTRLAHSGAVAGLCPITEANLGDGVFPLSPFLKERGTFGIGSDSNIQISPGEELRLLEYGQRLWHQQRCISLPDDALGSVGTYLWQSATQGGAQACGLPLWGVRTGARADLCVLDTEHLPIPARQASTRFDSALFATSRLPIRDVMCHGTWRVRDGEHPMRADALRAFAHVVTALLDD